MGKSSEKQVKRLSAEFPKIIRLTDEPATTTIKPNLRNQTSVLDRRAEMARPKAKELTERELEVMHVFWEEGEITIPEAREHLLKTGRKLAYTTVATLVRILCDKGFLAQKGNERPFGYLPIRTFEEVSGSIVSDLVHRVFGGSRDQLLVQLFGGKKLTAKERSLLEQVLREQNK